MRRRTALRLAPFLLAALLLIWRQVSSSETRDAGDLDGRGGAGGDAGFASTTGAVPTAAPSRDSATAAETPPAPFATARSADAPPAPAHGYEPPDVADFPDVARALSTDPSLTRAAAFLDHPLLGCGAALTARLHEFAAWHARARAALAAYAAARAGNATYVGAPDAPRVIVWQCRESFDNSFSWESDDDCGGLGDRLAGLANVLAFAVAHRWVVMSRNAVMAAVWHSPLLNVTWDPALLPPPDTWLAPDGMFNCPTGIDAADLPRLLGTAPVVLARVNRSPQRNWAPGVRAALLAGGVDPSVLTGCLVRTLMVPNARVVARILPALAAALAPGARLVGVHRRSGDRAMVANRRTIAAINTLWHCVRAAEAWAAAPPRNDSRPARYVFATDVAAMHDVAEAHFGPGRVVRTGVRPWHIDKYELAMGGEVLDWPSGLPKPNVMLPPPLERHTTTAAEFFLLSLAELFVIPGPSGYSRYAWLYSLVPHVFVYDGDACQLPKRGGDMFKFGNGMRRRRRRRARQLRRVTS